MSAYMLLLLPAIALSCPNRLVLSSSADTKIDRGNNYYTPATPIPYECDWHYTEAVCIWDSSPRSNGRFSFVEHFPLEAWMEPAVLSAIVSFQTADYAWVYMNGVLVYESSGGSCDLRKYLVYGRTNEFRLDVQNYSGSGRALYEVVISFSQGS